MANRGVRFQADETPKAERPEFLVRLGLMPPCTPEDVKQAYLAKAKLAHPDAGGSQEEFVLLQEAFERATQYAAFFAERRRWIGVGVERYIAQQALIAEIQSRGGRVQVESLSWLSSEVGDDFAQIYDNIVGIEWTGPGVTDAELELLVAEQAQLASLRKLDLSEASISDDGLLSLGVLTGLAQLELRGTSITHHGLAVLESLTALEQLGLENVDIGRFRLYRLRHAYPQLEIVH